MGGPQLLLAQPRLLVTGVDVFQGDETEHYHSQQVGCRPQCFLLLRRHAFELLTAAQWREDLNKCVPIKGLH